MARVLYVVAVGLLLSTMWGCQEGTGSPEQPAQPAAGGGRQARAAGAVGVAPLEIPEGAAPAASGGAESGGAESGGTESAAGAAGVSAPSATATGELLNFIPPTIISAVGGNVAALHRKETAGGADALGLLQPYLVVLQRVGIKPDQMEEMWAGTGRDKSDLAICVRTIGIFNPNDVVRAFGVTTAGQQVGAGKVFVPKGGDNAIAVVGNRTLLIGRKGTLQAALNESPPGPVRLGVEALIPNRPYYWIAGDDASGQRFANAALLGMVRLRSGDTIKLDCKAVALGLTDSGQAPPPPAGGPGQYGPPGGAVGPPAGGDSDGATPPPLNAVGAPPPPGSRPGGGAPPPPDGGPGAPPPPPPPPGRPMEFTVAIALEGEGQADILYGRITELVDEGEAADRGRQDGAGRAKAQKARLDATVKSMEDQAKQAANQPPLPPGPGINAPPRGVIPVGPPPVPAIPDPGIAAGAAGPAGIPGAGMPAAGMPAIQYKSTVPRPRLVKDQKVLRISCFLPSDRRNVAAALNWVGAAGRSDGHDRFYDGQFQSVFAAITGATDLRGQLVVNAEPNARHSWISQLLPFLGPERREISNLVDRRKSPLDRQNFAAASRPIPEFINPWAPRVTWSGGAMEGMALSHFVGMAGVEDRNTLAATLPRTDPRAGIFGYDSVMKLKDVSDGASQTILVIGADQTAGPWMVGGGATVRGARAPYLGKGAFSSAGLTKPGTIVVLADGSVRVLTEGMDPEVFKSLCTAHGGETIDMKAANLVDDPPAAPEAAPVAATSKSQ